MLFWKLCDYGVLQQFHEEYVRPVERCAPRIGRTSGYVVMLELMKRLAAKADPPFGVATMNEPRCP